MAFADAPEPAATPTAAVEPGVSSTDSPEPGATPAATVEPDVTPTAAVEPSATPTAAVEPGATPTVVVEPGVASIDSVEPDASLNRAPYAVKAVLSAARAQFASPAIADLDHDQYQEIVVGTTDGRVIAVKPNTSSGTTLWSFDTAAAINARARLSSGTTVRAAPAIADLDGDGWNEVIVSVGNITSANQNGGMIVLSHDGKLKSGWPQLTYDKYDPGYTEGIGTPPAVADLDNDGDLEIIAGTWDHRVYAWHHDGTWVKGWPQHVFDTVWSSPSVGDLDNDGVLEVVVGVDAHRDPYFGSIDGGALYVFRADGRLFPGFPVYMPENFESMPALSDLDGDGFLDIVIGGGAYYDHGSAGYKVHAVNRFGKPLAGWPVSTGGHVTGSPAIADLNRDGRPEVIVGSWDQKLYAWSSNGQLAAGFPVTPRNYMGATYQLHSPVVADANADGKPEIFTNYGWEVTELDWMGRQLTWDGAGSNAERKLTFFTNYTVDAPPAIADVNGDGKLELVAVGGEGGDGGGHATVYVWALAGSRSQDAAADWSTLKRDANRSGLRPCATTDDALVVDYSLSTLMKPGQTAQAQIVLRNNGSSTWTSGAGYALAADRDFYGSDRIPLPNGASVAPGQQVTFAFNITAPAQGGFYDMRWRMTRGDGQQFGRAATLEVKVGSTPLLYALRAAPGGGVYASDSRYPIAAPQAEVWWQRTRAFRLTTDRRGYYLLDEEAYFTWAGTAENVGSVGTRPAVEMALGPDRESVLVMDRYGRLSSTSAAMSINPAPPTFGDPRVRSFALTPDYKGIYTLDGNGRVYTSGTAAALNPATPVFSQDIAIKIKLRRDGKGYYVLDRWGNVYAGGNAPALKANYTAHTNEDWARDFELTEDETGYYLLDKFGGVWTGGSAPAPGQLAWGQWGDGTAMDLEVGDSRGEPGLELSLSSPQISMFGGLNRAPAPVRISINSGSGTLTWTANASTDWVKLSATSGKTPGALVVSLARALPEGNYSANLRLTAKDATGAVIDEVNVALSVKIIKKVKLGFLPLNSRQ